jgi:fucose 4-O-acetylase-like acetyltransferase
VAVAGHLVLQVMPVFFVVGGFSNMVSWQALERRGGGYVEYLSSRMSRLLRPVLVFAAVWLVLPPLLGHFGVPPQQTGPLGRVMGQPLWFLGDYLVVVALAPAMVRLHRRWRLRVPATLASAPWSPSPGRACSRPAWSGCPATSRT